MHLSLRLLHCYRLIVSPAGDKIQIEKVNDNEDDVEDEIVEPGDDRTIVENEKYDKNAAERGGDIEIDEDETRNDSKE